MANIQFSKSTAAAVRTAFGKAARVEQTAAAMRNAAGQRLVDELIMLCDNPDREKFFKSCGARAACIEIFKTCGLSDSAVRNYPTSVRLAFVHDVPFEAALFTREGKEKAGIPISNEAGAKGQNSGKVIKTTRADADKTLSKALAQYRALDLGEVAGLLLDVALDNLPDFKETMLDK